MANPHAVRTITVSVCGLEFAVAVGLFTWLGVRADARFGLEPFLTLSGLLFGIALGALSLRRTLDRIRRLDR